VTETVTPRRADRRYFGAIGFLATQTLLREVGRLHRMHEAGEDVLKELLRAAEDTVKGWEPVKRAARLGDLAFPDEEFERLDAQVRAVAWLIDQLAPQPADDESDWTKVVAAIAVGRRSSERKLLRVVGKHLADGDDPALARDHAHRLNATSCVPMLKPSRVDELVDLVIRKEAGL
jgi:hypothetical protein